MNKWKRWVIQNIRHQEVFVLRNNLILCFSGKIKDKIILPVAYSKLVESMTRKSKEFRARSRKINCDLNFEIKQINITYNGYQVIPI